MPAEKQKERLQMQMCLNELPGFLEEHHQDLLQNLKTVCNYDGEHHIKNWSKYSSLEKIRFLGELNGTVERLYQTKGFFLAIYIINGTKKRFLERIAEIVLREANQDEKNVYNLAYCLAKNAK